MLLYGPFRLPAHAGTEQEQCHHVSGTKGVTVSIAIAAAAAAALREQLSYAS